MHMHNKDAGSSGNLRYWQDGAYFQSWYALCLAEEVQEGQIVGRDFLGTRVIAYRDKTGAPVVQTAYCPHLGADLALGELVNGEVRCAYHRWQFASDGRCTAIPNLKKPPRAARLQNYPAAEAWGIIWAFNGAEPLYDVPSLVDVDEQDILYKTIDRQDEQMVDSWIPTSNSVDFQHLLSVHGFPHTAVPDRIDVDAFSLSYNVNLFDPKGKGRVTGHNTFSMRHLIPLPFDHFVMFASSSPRPGVVRAIFVVGVPKPSDPADFPNAQKNLEILGKRIEELYQEDENLLHTMRFRQRGDAKLVKQDAALGKFLDYIDALPRAKPFDY